MARKSRKHLNGQSESPALVTHADGREPKTRIPTAIYARLSNENNGREDDESIQNQIALVHSYLLDHADEFELAETYADNGRSGTNFDRPEFLRMMDDVNHGRIGCIMVKDLSRFGRNYVETGVYVENVLPKLGVRLIAVNDSFDSSRESDRLGVTVPMKNMINETYARDVSRKMFIANRVRRMKPDVLPLGPVAYGYKKDESGKRLIPDENADYVRVAYQWRIMGVSFVEIADRLNLIGAPVPGRLMKGEKGGTEWTRSGVCKMLANPIYTGDTCLGRTRRTRLASQKGVIRVPRDQWTIHKNTHEALVPRNDFEAIYESGVQNAAAKKAIAEKHKKAGPPIPADFSNLVWCGECQKKMITKREKKGGQGFTHVKYVCTNRKKTDRACYNVVFNDFLKVTASEQVRMHLKVLSDRAELIRKLNESEAGKNAGLSIDKKIAAAKTKLLEEREKEARLYEDFRGGVIEEDDFRLIHEKCVLARQEAECRLKALGTKKDEYARVLGHFLDVTGNTLQAAEDDGFDAALVKETVERIYAYGNNRIEVVLKNEDVDRVIEEALEGFEE